MNTNLMNEFTRQYMKAEGKWFDLRWHYVPGCIMKSYLDLYEVTENNEYLDFVKSYIDRLFDEKDNPIGFRETEYNIDQVRICKTVLDLYAIFPEEKYKKAADRIFQQFENYPRTKEGSFWHKEFYYNQVWLDGLYMGQPFYVHYIRDFLPDKDYSDTINQFEVCRKRLYDPELKLYKHAYDEAKKMDWADRQTGRSSIVWLRAVGWYLMALVDVMEIIGPEETGYPVLQDLLTEALEGLMPYRHESGMWYQVVDQGGRENNYLETSGTCMASYAMLKGVRMEILPQEYRKRGLESLEGTVEQYLHKKDGEILIGGICRSAGLGMHPEAQYMRDGSYDYYTTGEQVVENNGHGVAPLFMAYAESLRISEI
ncbi:glycosyl hydrolase [Marispirochaeta aestuarii]|uniref:Glycosyl hydrolase n=1 Tax=Marispirochaeta aestuarii TaxID=1963862 RepID=A0A1Y1RZI3_9SPIO|nr:glycoside hydrolase family 88 protein [Marispirochaeta aestuarii]ORC36226.1 glycosyl hydrolase [Marispirochaeta aestuarii]